MLFVSGEKAERFPKAMAAGADLVCIDLEDAVHADRKQLAREQVLGWLSKNSSSDGPAIALRINGLRTLEGLRDVLALNESGVHLDWLLVPKVEDAADLQALHAWAGPCYDRLTALIETPHGVENALSIARAGGKLAAPDARRRGSGRGTRRAVWLGRIAARPWRAWSTQRKRRDCRRGMSRTSI